MRRVIAGTDGWRWGSEKRRRDAGATGRALPGGFGEFVGKGAFLAGGDFFGLGFDAFEHAAEDEVMKGKDAVPVEDAEQAFGLEFRDLF
jgi:hypothetical protein